MRRVSLVALVALLAFAPYAMAATLQAKVQATWNGQVANDGEAILLDPVGVASNPYVKYEIAFEIFGADTMGLSQIVLDVTSAEAQSAGYQFASLYDGDGGWSNAAAGGPAFGDIKRDAYGTVAGSYYGGWGFNNSGFATGGVGGAGEVLGAGNSMPLVWSGDLQPGTGGIQAQALMGVGIEPHNLPAADGNFGGLQAGFGQDLYNGGAGSGEWVMFVGFLNVANWDQDVKYNINIVPKDGNFMLVNDLDTGNPIDYTQELQGGYRNAFTDQELFGTVFQIVPEPATLSLLALGGLGLLRRRR